SPIVIKEPVPRVAIVALGLSLIGIILVLQPRAAPGIDPASLAALGAATISAFAHLTVRRLNATDDPLMIVAVFSVVTSAMGGVVGAESHIFPGVSAWLLVVGIALTATGAQLLMTHAYGRERASVVAAAGYMHVVYALIFGWIFWREWPPTRALIGAAVIIGAGILLAVARSKIRELPRDRDKSAE
ncbi:MAG: DMT family transporter, partial [Deltaproteobacteria bacterium]|nr:DMT family transporter [Deltaproteobacteria bacterium]